MILQKILQKRYQAINYRRLIYGFEIGEKV